MRGQRRARRGQRARVALRVRALLAQQRGDPGVAAAPGLAVVQVSPTRAAHPGAASPGQSDERWGVEMDLDEWPSQLEELAPTKPDRSPPDDPSWSATTQHPVPQRGPTSSPGAPPPAHAAAGHVGGPAATRPLSGWLERRGIRIDPGRRAAAAVGLAVVVVGLLAGWWVLAGRPHQVAVSMSSPTPLASGAPSSVMPASGVSAPVPPASVGSAGAQVVVVDVVGRVRRPGVYRLPVGSRVDDVLHAAGGALPGVDLSQLNLARKVGDGEQVAVGVDGAAVSGVVPSGSAGVGAPPAGPVDLNTASLEQLDGLPGVGPVLAQRILDWRAAHGRFESVDQLREVSGIGPSRYDELRPLITV